MEEEYPTNEDLEMIEDWKIESYKDKVQLSEFICKIWHFDNWATLKGKRVKTLRLATGGWSGNEDILGALRKNLTFHISCWQKSERGGLVIYKIRP